MEITVIEQNHPQALPKAKSILLSGGVIAIPTDTVYGIACLINNPKSINRLYSIKERDVLKAIPVLIGKIEQTQKVTVDFPKSAQVLSKHFWPGALTLVVNKHPDLPNELTTYPTVGVRMPNHDWLRHLMVDCGPLAATSANISGDPSLSTAQEVINVLGDKVDLFVNGGTCEGGIPSTVVDCTQSPITILRDGGITKNTIFEALSEIY